ncbi:TetR/AcrR family transcriptional regulator [Mucilaginibacter lappiensis]|uniref:TetR/AcrR family transcriptional regulator n=1 Tax=Mucilaginibacter lappiensis TaxID=354630 RepID=UPI003D23BFBD
MISKERIIDGCEDLFLKAGIRAVTMDDIAKHLGISKKTIYQHYSVKEKLIYTWVYGRILAEQQQLDLHISRSKNMIDQLIAMERLTLEIFAKINPILIQDLERYYTDSWLVVQRFKSEFLTSCLENLLIKGIAEGYIRSELDPLIIAKLYIGQMDLVFNQILYPNVKFDLYKVQSQILENFNFGICTNSGLELITNSNFNLTNWAW